MDLNYYMATAMMDQVRGDRLREAANERLWRKALRATQGGRKAAGASTSARPSSVATI